MKANAGHVGEQANTVINSIERTEWEKKIRGRRAGGSKGGLHAAGAVRIARHGSGGPSQRPGPPRRAQKGAGDIVSSVESLTRTDTKT